MPKVVHLTSVHYVFDTRIFHRECVSLARAGYEVALVGSHAHDEYVSGVYVKAVGKPANRLRRMLRATWKMYREAIRQNAEVYHFHDPELIPTGLLLAARGKKVIYDVHEDLAADLLEKDYLPARLRGAVTDFVVRLERFAMPRFSAVVCATSAIAERLGELNPRTIVLRNYPRNDELAPPSGFAFSERCNEVVYAGGISPVRGLRQAIRAMGELPPELNATLNLAGPYWQEEFRAELMQEAGWARVRELGMLDRRGVADVLRKSRVGLLTYHPVRGSLRSEPNKLFEYMSAGIPVVASNFPEWRSLVEQVGCGLVVDPFDHHAIAEAIQYLLTNPTTAHEMGLRGRRAAEDTYTWASEERKLRRLYRELVGAPVAGLKDRGRTSVSHSPTMSRAVQSD